MFAYWDEEIRPQIAEVWGVKAGIKIDELGDLRTLRRHIAHRKGLLPASEHAKLKGGGSCGPSELDIAHQRAGLKIWASWAGINHVLDAPLFEGNATMAMAGEVFGIFNPDDQANGVVLSCCSIHRLRRHGA